MASNPAMTHSQAQTHNRDMASNPGKNNRVMTMDNRLRPNNLLNSRHKRGHPQRNTHHLPVRPQDNNRSHNRLTIRVTTGQSNFSYIFQHRFYRHNAYHVSKDNRICYDISAVGIASNFANCRSFKQVQSQN